MKTVKIQQQTNKNQKISLFKISDKKKNLAPWGERARRVLGKVRLEIVPLLRLPKTLERESPT